MKFARIIIVLAAAFVAAGMVWGAGNGSRPPVTPVDHVRVMNMVRADSGKPVLLNLWATWCDPCREEMPKLLQLRTNYASKGLQVLLVSADEGANVEKTVSDTLAKFGVDFETYIEHDASDEAFINGIDSSWSGTLPTTLLFDRKGKIVARLTGGKTYGQFEREVKKLLK